MNKFIIECDNVSKTYQDGKLSVEVLRNINFSVKKQESIAILGNSGSGKSTLLHLMGGLDYPSTGTVRLMKKDIFDFNAKALGLWRSKNLGFVYQSHYLLPEFDAQENVMLPLLIAKMSVKKACEKAAVVLKQVGLAHRLNHRPAELSGGEKQRVSIARAIVNQPACVLCDEPTGNLDNDNAKNILSLLKNLQQQLELAFVVVTHDQDLAHFFNRVLLMSDGQLYEHTP